MSASPGESLVVGVGKAVFTEACKLDKMARPRECRGPEWKAAGIS